MRTGVIALQGDVSEHVHSLKRAAAHMGIEIEVVPIRRRGTVPSCDVLVLPGGESTTLCRLLSQEGILEELVDAAHRGMPILATCAGLIVLASEGDELVERTGQRLAGVLDIAVRRNAFGRQRESFEAPVEVKGIGTFPAVFIRAPAVERVGEAVEVIATLDGRIVGVQQDNTVAVAFHPELTEDVRLHAYVLSLALGSGTTSSPCTTSSP
ncbi:pyridoxal 5'-phosphate synthase glutaminase subunit PdxT [Methermicoccus shengliensis]|uniref:Pyridoxal 5'-phosphate synthase subunit PdxT n=1 Tax=Methermicoccus shengliensis TaxID=660064 RepID=A0A832VXF5_9EURY|nr:pyridoxal 5'-phosphate synthase glutaminase subunit PdxT [Methermicoccus shengliensis]HIH69693.1 pyridoxal 5'-phosphate synthase glutaminase subunit PdxT [Methermicoccus shengliensis]